MATHSSVLAWRIPGTGNPGGLPSMGSHRVGHDWSDTAAAAAEHIEGTPHKLRFVESKFLVLNWNIVDLQYCVSFKCTAKWISFTYMHCFMYTYTQYMASLVAQSGKNLLAVQETRVQSLGWEDPLEKEMASHSSILAWKIPWIMEPGRLLSMGLQRLRHDWATSLSLEI